ncbi:MAG: hypothetical protein R6U29_09400 [Desulfosudaceae bacterium]
MKKAIAFILLAALISLSGCGAFKKQFPGKTSPPPEEDASPAVLPETEIKDVKRPRYTKPSQPASDPAEARKIIDQKLTLARQHLGKGRYGQVPPLVNEVLALDQANPEALTLLNSAYYQWGHELYNQGEYHQALAIMDRVSPGYKGTKEFKTRIHHKMASEAEASYKVGVMYFINEDLEKAIAAWEKTLRLNPSHPTAEKNIENAKNLLDEYQKIED